MYLANNLKYQAIDKLQINKMTFIQCTLNTETANDR